jgi:cytochrome c-type biogenesis protein
MSVTIGLAFLAGLASFLSPCVFSLVPVYISYLSGRSMAALQTDAAQVDRRSDRWQAFSHGLAFVLGFSVVFITLGMASSALGQLLYNARDILSKIGGVIVIIFGLQMIGIIRIPFLTYDLRPQTSLQSKRSYLSSALLGVVFSAGWSPCVGPVLGAILTMAFYNGSIGKGIQLLTAYSAGLAIPFLLAAIGIGWVAVTLRKFRKVVHSVEIVMGVILVVVGGMLFLGTFEQLSRFGFFVNFGI